MKRSLFALPFILAVALAGCSKFTRDNLFSDTENDASILTKSEPATEGPFECERSDNPVDYYFITPETASDFVTVRFPDQTVAEATAIVEKDATVYLFNFEKGWAVVSSDKRTQAVLAFNKDNRLAVNGLKSEPLSYWFELILDELSALRKYNPDIKNEHTKMWEDFEKQKYYRYDVEDEDQQITKGPGDGEEHHLWAKILVGSVLWGEQTVTDIGHLISTKWGQDYPWNVSMPIIGDTGYKMLTGCTAVAVSQLLYYYHNHIGYPSYLYHDSFSTTDYHILSPSPDISGYAFVSMSRGSKIDPSSQWDDMALTQSSNGNSNRFKYVSDLMLDIGDLVDMQYSFEYFSVQDSIWRASGTTNTIIKAKSALYDYGLTCSDRNYRLQEIVTDLQNNRPLFIRGSQNSSSSGHSWIIDGYQERSLTYKNHYMWFLIDDPDGQLWEQCDVIDEDPTSIHYEGEEEYSYDLVTERFLKFNWGWNGFHDDTFASLGTSGEWQSQGFNSSTTQILHNIIKQGGYQPGVL